MKEEILQKIKKEYQSRCDLQKDIKNMESRLEKLEQVPEVREYLSLLDKLEEVDNDRVLKWKNDKMISDAYSLYRKEIDETNGIFVCLGTFRISNEADIVHGRSDIRLSYDDSTAEFRSYVDLEKSMLDSFSLPISLCSDFESQHTVIFPSVFSSERYFYQLQKEFLNDAISSGQEQAVHNVLVKTGKSNF